MNRTGAFVQGGANIKFTGVVIPATTTYNHDGAATYDRDMDLSTAEILTPEVPNYGTGMPVDFFDASDNPLVTTTPAGNIANASFTQFNSSAGSDNYLLTSRHDVVLVVGRDAQEELGLGMVTGDEGLVAAEVHGRTVRSVESQVGLPVVGIGSVACEALVEEDGPDVSGEVHVAGGDEAEGKPHREENEEGGKSGSGAHDFGIEADVVNVGKTQESYGRKTGDFPAGAGKRKKTSETH